MSPGARKCAWALALLALALVVLVLVIARQLRDPQALEQYASMLLGRELSIGELHELRLGREPSIVVEGLSIANPDWVGQPYFLRLEWARVHLDLASLWRDGPLVITDLEIDGLQVALLQEDGKGANWQFGTEAPAADAEGDAALALPVVLEQAHIRAAEITYRSADADLRSSLDGQLQGGNGLALEVDGRWQGEPLRASGRVEKQASALRLDGAGEYRGWRAALAGALADPIAFTGLDLQLQLEGRQALPADGQDPARSLPLSLQIHLNGSGRWLELSRGLLVSGDSQLTINGSLGNPASLRGLDLDLVFDSADLKALLAPGTANERPVALALQTRLRSDGDSLRLEKLSARSAGASLRGDISLPMTGGLEGALLELYAEGASFGEVLAPWTAPSLPDLPFELDLEGHWQSPSWHLQTFRLAVGESHLDAALSLTPEEQGIAADGRIRFSGQRAQRALAALGVTARLPDESFMMDSQVRLAADARLEVTDLDLQLGGSDLSGALSYAPGSPARVEARLHSDKLDLRSLSESIQQQLRQADGASVDTSELDSSAPLSAAQLQARLIPDTPLDLAWLDAAEGQFSLDVDEVLVGEGLQSHARVGLRLADGRLLSDEIQWQGSFSTGQAGLSLANARPGARFELRLESHRLPLIWLLTGNPAAEQQADYRMALASEGASLRELAAGLDGSVYLRGEGGKIDNNGLGLVLGDVFGEIFSRINPLSEREAFTRVECHAGGLLLEDGLVTLAPGMVVRTDKIDLALGGSVDLNSEQLDVIFNTRSRTGIGISASKALTPYLKLGGNFSYPRLGVNAKGVVVSGGAAFATGGLSILAEGMWDRWVATSVNPCEALFKQNNQVESELKKLFGRPL